MKSKKMIFLKLCVFILLLSEVQILAQTTSVSAKIGETVTLTCHPGRDASELRWLFLDREEVIFSYVNETAYVRNPNLYEVTTDGAWFNLTIKRVNSKDVGQYSCNQTAPTFYEELVALSLNGITELRNMVVRYSSALELTYNTTLSGTENVQWTYMNIDWDENKTINHVYYASATGGGVLSFTNGGFEPAGVGHGVFINSVDQYSVGKYKYFFMDPPSVVEKEFWVAGTEGLECQPIDHIFENRLHSHSCSAVVGFGDIVPMFAWTKNGNPEPGMLQLDPNYSGYGRRWVYSLNFVPGLDDANATFTCTLTFRYRFDSLSSEGPTLQADSDPDYTETCDIVYPYVDFSVRETTITPNSETEIFAIRVGQNLTCSALGYPEVTYKWNCLGFPDMDGPIYTITKPMTEVDIVECECFARNTLSDGETFMENTTVEFLATHASGIREIPQDIVVPYGWSARLQCTALDFGNDTNDWRVQWAAEFDYEPETSSILYYSNRNGSGVLSDWGEDFIDGGNQHDLFMRYAIFNLAGTYFCMELSNSETDSWKAEVVVTTVVQCAGQKDETSKDGSHTQLSCQLEYAGHIEPLIEWYQGNKLLEGGTTSVVKKQEAQQKQRTIQVGSASSWDSVKQDIGNKRNDVIGTGLDYKCIVTFVSNKEVLRRDECSVKVGK